MRGGALLILVLSACGSADREGREERAAATSAAAPTSTAGSPNTSRNLDPRRGESDAGLVELAAVEVSQGSRVTEAELRDAVDAKRAELLGCVKGDTFADVKGKVMPSGSLQEVRVTKIQPEDVLLRDCLVAVLGTVRVASVRSGDASAITLKLGGARSAGGEPSPPDKSLKGRGGR
jgi:hypothetical protein